ncbi:KDGP aldolase, partial [Salmonella enterica]|uniref:KDGP aldolase n=1 Tax=Salmonella enterica TaxID=28901 RepID=UPI0011176524
TRLKPIFSASNETGEIIWLEPTGGIDLENFAEILHIALDAGVSKIIPHIYSSIIDKVSGNTRADDVRQLLAIVRSRVG